MTYRCFHCGRAVGPEDNEIHQLILRHLQEPIEEELTATYDLVAGQGDPDQYDANHNAVLCRACLEIGLKAADAALQDRHAKALEAGQAAAEADTETPFRWGMNVLRERAAEAGIELGERIDEEVFRRLGLPMVVACTHCEETMAFPAAFVDGEGRCYCGDCGEALSPGSLLDVAIPN
ncbi:MAG: hypothetical protein ACM3US_10780 [Sphingomonadaceae bacterium]